MAGIEPEPLPFTGPPIGIALASAAREVNRAFEATLATAGGSRPVWLILMALHQRPGLTQRQLAARVGIREATLTHHLAAMDAAGLSLRRRDPHDRRNQTVMLTAAGQTRFHELRGVVIAFDARLRAGLDEAALSTFRGVLARLTANVAGEHAPRVVSTAPTDRTERKLDVRDRDHEPEPEPAVPDG